MLPLKKIPECRHSLLSREAAEVLTELCSTYKPKIIVEVGAFVGFGSTRIFAAFADQVIAVDHCAVQFTKRPGIERTESHLHLLLNNLRDYKNVDVLRASSMEAASMLDIQADLIFIDGGHSETEVKMDLAMWLPKLKVGGVICGDDYSEKFPGVVKAVAETLGEHQNQDRIWWKVMG